MINKKVDMMTEFGNAFREISDTIINGSYRDMTQEQRTKMMNDALESLSEDTMVHYIDTIIKQVNMFPYECQKYDNTNLQVQSIIDRLPRLGNYKDKLTEKVIEARNKAKVGL